MWKLKHIVRDTFAYMHICSYIFIDVQKHLTQQIQTRMHQDTSRICSFPNTNPFRIFNFLHIHMYACNHISARKDIFHMRMHQNLYRHFHFHVHLQTPKQFFSNTENTLIFKHKHIHAQLQRQLHYSQACLQVTYHSLAHWHKHVNLQRHIHGNSDLHKTCALAMTCTVAVACSYLSTCAQTKLSFKKNHDCHWEFKSPRIFQNCFHVHVRLHVGRQYMYMWMYL